MTLRRFLATHWPCTAIASFVASVEAELVAEKFARVAARWSETLPGIHEQSLASWGIHEDPLTIRQEVERVRAILDGATPSELPRAWGEEIKEARALTKEEEAFDRILRRVANERLFGKRD